jgi:2',3'-cyclic-nucleotide 2'-phosphodiesterase (5'-nucleotidase family)
VKTIFSREGKRVGAIALSGLAILALAGVVLVTARSARATVSARQDVANAQVRVAETESGNLVADAVRAAGNADIGFVPAAAFKAGASVPRSASPDQLASLVEPASDTIVVLNVRGDKVLAALERSVSFAPQPSAGFLQVSGIKFSYDSRKASQSRVSGVTVGGAPLEASKVYKVAMTKPLSIGQQGYFQIWDRESKPAETGKSLATAIADFVKGQGVPGVEGRINALK